MAGQAKAAMGVEALDVLADRGYFDGEEVLACEALGVTPYVPKPLTSGAKADGRFGKQDFVYLPRQDAYRCPAGQLLPHHMTTVENGHEAAPLLGPGQLPGLRAEAPMHAEHGAARSRAGSTRR